jgi:hypothetical protein
MNEAQLLLDATAISISVYCLLQFHKLEMSFRLHRHIELEKEIKQVSDSIPKEIYSETLEPGIYMPKTDEKGEVTDYAKTMDVEGWKELIAKA